MGRALRVEAAKPVKECSAAGMQVTCDLELDGDESVLQNRIHEIPAEMQQAFSGR